MERKRTMRTGSSDVRLVDGGEADDMCSLAMGKLLPPWEVCRSRLLVSACTANNRLSS